jgi:thiol-disulfide isomerase/thioredoxin
MAAAVPLLVGAVALASYRFGPLAFIAHLDRGEVPARAPDISGPMSSKAFELSLLDQPRALPELRFVGSNGEALTLGDFRGRPVLLNIWATWCVPCRQEMPALDRLQAAFDKSQFLVLPLSIDRKGVPAVKSFYQELGLETLGIYVDETSKAARALDTVGVPTTLLIDREGREIGRKIGPAEWDSPDMVALIREHLGLPSRDQKASP